jgi:hypothetical protein
MEGVGEARVTVDVLHGCADEVRNRVDFLVLSPFAPVRVARFGWLARLWASSVVRLGDSGQLARGSARRGLRCERGHGHKLTPGLGA